MRDDFKKDIKRRVAERVGYRCSNPRCRKLTSMPNSDPQRSVNIGVAAHITAASPGGCRFDVNLTKEQRASIDNAIWLCQTCAAMIDRDCSKYSVTALQDWKQRAEQAALADSTAISGFRAISPSELHQEFTIGEFCAISALSEEFGCVVTPDVNVPTEEGWINLHAAVVRGEDLVAIEIWEPKNGKIPYFQIEYLIELRSKLKFPRFRNFVLYVAVVSDDPPELDEEIQEHLRIIANTPQCEVHIRMYRLNELRAKYNL